MVELNITEEDCRNIAEILEIYFFKNIRDDETIDNIDYVKSIIKSIDELNRIGGYYR